MSGPTGPTGEPCAIIGLAGFAWLLSGAILFAFWLDWRKRHD